MFNFDFDIVNKFRIQANGYVWCTLQTVVASNEGNNIYSTDDVGNKDDHCTCVCVRVCASVLSISLALSVRRLSFSLPFAESSNSDSSGGNSGCLSPSATYIFPSMRMRANKIGWLLCTAAHVSFASIYRIWFYCHEKGNVKQIRCVYTSQ